MHQVTQSEFNDWKANPVTRAFFLAAMERAEEAKNYLATTAGLNSADDNYYRGFIQAYREVPEFRVEDLEGDSQ